MDYFTAAFGSVFGVVFGALGSLAAFFAICAALFILFCMTWALLEKVEHAFSKPQATNKEAPQTLEAAFKSSPN